MLDALVIGAGPAGLATSRELSARGVEHRVLERGDGPGHVWSQLYDSLTLHTGRHLSTLPGMPFPRGTPLFVSRTLFLDYLRRYAGHFRVPIEARCEVRSLARSAGGWIAETSTGTVAARAVVVATGIASNPRVPQLPGREAFGGEVVHSIAYRRPQPYIGRRVLVVGVGNSAGEIATELAGAGAQVTLAVRTGAHVVPLTLAGIPIQYVASLIQVLPRGVRGQMATTVSRLREWRDGPSPLPKPAGGPLDTIPLIGFRLVDALREGRIQLRPGVETLTSSGARFSDGREEPFDHVLLATGYRPALAPLAGRVTTDARGFAVRSDRVTSADQPRLWFVGHNYDVRGALLNIRRDAGLAAERVGRELRRG